LALPQAAADAPGGAPKTPAVRLMGGRESRFDSDQSGKLTPDMTPGLSAQ
jgi:hypothetical protein